MPNRKSAKNAKRVEDYQQAREVKDLVRFATSQMPNFVERVKDAKELKAVQAKREEWGLPMVLVFSKSGSTSSTLKSLSTEFRRKLIVVEHKAGKDSPIAKQYGVQSFPAVLGFPPPGAAEGAGAPLRFDKEPTYNKLDSFFRKVALKKPVMKKPAQKEEL